MDEVAGWLEANKLRAQAWFTVDDLKYLRRGGRIGAMAATVGTMLDLKPIITENRAGKLVSSDKVRGPEGGAAPDRGQGRREHRRSRSGDDHHPACGRP